MCFSPFFFYTTQRKRDGQAQGSAVVTPSRGERWGRHGEAAGKLWLGYGLPLSQASEG